MINERLPKIFYGGDYNPDQWPEEIWDEDMRLFRLADIDIATVGVFSWSLLQPDEVTYDFSFTDKILDKLFKNGIHVCLATATAAHPAWMAKRYPDILRVDFQGRQRRFGGRHNSCPNSPTYRHFAPLMAEGLAERYSSHPSLLVWHINNEYGGTCYCENCARQFRVWLKRRYGSLDRLNEVWNTAFWGHRFYDWDEIVPPNILSEHMDENDPTRTAFQGISLDYARFNSDSLLECYKLEYEAIRKHCSDVPITTNMMGTFKPLDYFKWAPHVDVISWDSYPRYNTPMSHVALRHDLMRGLRGGQPFMLMEQTPSQQNWQPYNSLKRPGVMRLWSYQAIAHGADTVMFFQLRRSIGACEKYHGAVIEHAGHENTRVFRECANLGSELKGLGDTLLDARISSRVAILFDWDNWWAVEFSSGPSVDLKYVEQIQVYYDALYRQTISVDVVSIDTDLSGYDIVIAPVLYMVKAGAAERLESFVEEGGTFVTTFFSGLVDDNDRVVPGGYPGPLRRLLGIWAEEIDALPPEMHNSIVMKETVGSLRGQYACSLLFDLVHCETAEALAAYGADFYRGMPVLTRNTYGKGVAYYVASCPDTKFVEDFIKTICDANNIRPAVENAPDGLEAVIRQQAGRRYLFLLNHAAEAPVVSLQGYSGRELLTNVRLDGSTQVAPRGVQIIELEETGA